MEELSLMPEHADIGDSDGESQRSDEPLNENDDQFYSFSEEGEELGASSSSGSEKDETELELEKLVFGDAKGFKNELRLESRHRTGGHEDALESHEGDRALAVLDDSELFFVDSGPEDQLLTPKADFGNPIHPSKRRIAPAWQDSEDERIMVSLMAVPRLRKLRHYEGEDVINGIEYTRRLRQQFELLNPRPKWADWKPETRSRKRKRGSMSGDSLGEDKSSDDVSDSSDEEMSTQPLAKLLRGSEALIRAPQLLSNRRRKLQAEAISIERMKDIPPTQPSAITSLSIHSTLPLILSSGPSSTLYLHSLLPHPIPPDPPNPLVTSLHLKNTPLSTTSFSPTVRREPELRPKVYMSSRRRYFHVWDLQSGSMKKITRIYGQGEEQRSMEILKPSHCGRYVALKGSGRKGGGVINILDSESLQWISQIRVESQKGIADFVWWRDGTGMTIAGRSGEISEWVIENEAVVARWHDEGAVGTTTLALGGEVATKTKAGERSGLNLGPDRWIAIGSTAGIVNIYDRSGWTKQPTTLGLSAVIPSNPKPTKTLENLTTPISHLAFSPCGQLLALASRWKRDALRLVHLPSCTAYKNWPTSKTPFGRISALTFGEYDGTENGEEAVKTLVLAVGNESGALRAWEIGH